MKINEFIFESPVAEARRNNYGREISNVQGQALGKKLAAGDPNAQQALAQAKAAQATNTSDRYGSNMDTLGMGTPQARLAGKKNAKAWLDAMGIDSDEIRTPQAQQAAPAQNAQAQQAAPAQQGPSATDRLKGAWNTTKNVAGKAGDIAGAAYDKADSAYNAVAQVGDRMAQSKLGQTLGGWSQRLIGVGNRSAAAQQIWSNQYMSMVNNLIANAKNSKIKLDFSNAIDQYMLKQKIKIDPKQRQYIKSAAAKVQQNGFQRADIVKLGNTIWTTGVNASSNPYQNPSAIVKNKNTTVPAVTTPGDKAIGSIADTLQANADEKQSSGAMSQMANQLSGSQPAEPTQAATATEPTTPTKPKPQATSGAPVGTKFALNVRGQLVKAEKTADGWKVQGKLINDPKQAAVLDKQSQLVARNKGRPGTASPARPPQTKIQPNRPSKPVRTLKSPSALAKGTPGKPASAGKSRIR